ncbi:MAG: hypothetical protein E6J34_00420 [Chloroflexi bacterium]|nr:MAG: hypothetical protein E6J34_00420 [Chloroflexota bacterium]
MTSEERNQSTIARLRAQIAQEYEAAQRDLTGITSGASPKFLQVGDTMVAVAHIVSVDKRENGDVEILITHDNEVLTFHDEEARLFMELFKEHCQIVSKTV